MMKRILLILSLFPILTFGQRDWSNVEIPSTEIAPGIYRLFVDNRVAVVISVGNDGIMMIDAAYEQTAEKLLAEVKKISEQPLKYLVNTHIHGDHTGGNTIIGKGVDIIAHQHVKDYLSTERKQGEKVIPPLPEYAVPKIIVNEKMELGFNEEKVQIIPLIGGHTGGDIIIHFPNAKVLVVGDLLFADNFPYVDTGNGGNPFKYLENVLWITQNFADDVTVIGGHGPVYNMQQYREYHQTLQKTIDTVREHKQNGLTPEQMKEQRILKEWESMGKFFITEDRWIDTLYPFL